MIKFKALFLVSLLIAGGCQMHQNSTENESGSNGQQVRDDSTANIDRKESQEISKRIEKIVLEVPNVKAADAIVLGNYTFVAVDVGKNVERSQVDSIKHAVAKSLENDPNGKNAVIVADPDIIARLKEVGNDIANGAPLSGIMNELSDIAGRIMPEINGLNETPNDVKREQLPNDVKKEIKTEENQ